MSFKSYISVDVNVPKGYYDWDDDEQDVFWQRVVAVQAEAEQAYKSVLLMYSGKIDFDYDIESK